MFLKILQYPQENTCAAVLESLLIKITGLQACNSIKKRLQHNCFPVNIEKFFKNSFSYRTALMAASGIERFLLFAIYATLKIYEDS